MTVKRKPTFRKKSAVRKKTSLTKKQKKQLLLEIIVLSLATVGAVTILLAIGRGVVSAFSTAEEATKVVEEQPELDVELLSINDYSRPGQTMEEVNAIVIHYTANPGSTALQNRDYFEGLKTSHTTMASSHFIVGLEGEIVQCIPTSEISYASNDRNNDTVSIECCHPDESGAFNQATYDSLVQLSAYLLGKFDLTTDDVIRHYDVSRKNCPKYYVENEDAWQQFLADINTYIDTYGVVQKDAE